MSTLKTSLFEGIQPELEDRLRARMETVDRLLHTHLVHPEDPFLTEAALHLITAGGKRMRPLLTLLAAEFGTPGREEVESAAALVELAHVGSLYHDDVMDKAPARHGVATGHTLWGNRMAILVGDYILAKAAKIGAELGPGAVRRQARTLTRLVEGQLHETMGPRPGEDPVTHYLRVVSDKSAALLVMAVQLGAEAAGAPDDVLRALTAYAEEVGTAFQICDDLLDITSDSLCPESGKRPGTDLREGVATLPVLYALADDSADSVRLRELLADGPVTEGPDVEEALRILRNSPGTVKAYLTARSHADRARQALESLPGIPAREALAHVCDFVTDRRT